MSADGEMLQSFIDKFSEQTAAYLKLIDAYSAFRLDPELRCRSQKQRLSFVTDVHDWNSGSTNWTISIEKSRLLQADSTLQKLFKLLEDVEKIVSSSNTL